MNYLDANIRGVWKKYKQIYFLRCKQRGIQLEEIKSHCKMISCIVESVENEIARLCEFWDLEPPI